MSLDGWQVKSISDLETQEDLNLQDVLIVVDAETGEERNIKADSLLSLIVGEKDSQAPTNELLGSAAYSENILHPIIGFPDDGNWVEAGDPVYSSEFAPIYSVIEHEERNIQVSSSSDFSETEVDDTVSEFEPSTGITDNLEPGEYYIRAKDVGSRYSVENYESLWSDSQQFSVVENAVEAPQLISPESGDVLEPGDIDFEGDDAQFYDDENMFREKRVFEIYVREDDDSYTLKDTIEEDSNSVTVDLEEGEFAWRIKDLANRDISFDVLTYESPWSEKVDFDVESDDDDESEYLFSDDSFTVYTNSTKIRNKNNGDSFSVKLGEEEGTLPTSDMLVKNGKAYFLRGDSSLEEIYAVECDVSDGGEGVLRYESFSRPDFHLELSMLPYFPIIYFEDTDDIYISGGTDDFEDAYQVLINLGDGSTSEFKGGDITKPDDIKKIGDYIYHAGWREGEQGLIPCIDETDEGDLESTENVYKQEGSDFVNENTIARIFENEAYFVTTDVGESLRVEKVDLQEEELSVETCYVLDDPEDFPPSAGNAVYADSENIFVFYFGSSDGENIDELHVSKIDKETMEVVETSKLKSGEDVMESRLYANGKDGNVFVSVAPEPNPDNPIPYILRVNKETLEVEEKVKIGFENKDPEKILFSNFTVI